MAERGWQEGILEEIPSGVDVSQIDERLLLTPTERLEHMRKFLEALNQAKATHDERLSRPR